MTDPTTPEPSEPTTPEPSANSRRDFMKKAAVAGGAVVWATPVVQTLAMKAAAAESPGPGTSTSSSQGGGSGTLTGTVIDASTTNPIAGATVSIQGDGSATTDGSGAYTINNAPAGNQLVSASAPGYATASTSTSIPSGGTATQNFQLSALGEIRIVLTWNDQNSDLDLHASGPDGSSGRFHIAWYSPNPVQHASLDVDDRDGDGPETITITISTAEGDFVAGDYHIWVHNYAHQVYGEVNFAGTDANVKFFDTTSQAGEFLVGDATGNADDDIWHVFNFTINDNGDVTGTTVVQTLSAGTDGTVL